jgi:hypothetical protein
MKNLFKNFKTFNSVALRGFSFVETMVATAIFLIVALSIYQTYAVVFKLVSFNKAKTAALELAEERIEVVRNLPYASIGIISGIPVGILPRFAEYSRSGFVFQATTTVRNIDDPFDGTISGTPNDLSPADYKIVEVEIGCVACSDFPSFVVTAISAPKSLETTSGNGALFVRVIDANGQAVPDANVILTGQGTSTVLILENTNNDGILQLVDVPPGNFMYRTFVTKAGYSSSTTYVLGGVGNPNPLNPDSTVAAGSVTQLTLSIDALSSVNLRTVTETCGAIASVPVNFQGTKKIGTIPDVYKFGGTYTTNGAGLYSLPSVEWDSYTVSLGGGYVLGGSIPTVPLSLPPGVTQDVFLLAKAPNPNALLVTVRDYASGLPVSDANVRIYDGSYDDTIVTNKGFFTQTDWTAGSGQESFGSLDKFGSSDGQIEYSNTPGQLSLKDFFGTYLSSGNLTSSWYDIGDASTTLYALSWQPVSQASSTGSQSVMFQIDSGDSTTTTTGFIGPDDSSLTFYTSTTTAISSIHNNHRYFRYKLYLSTADVSVTPIVSDVSVTFGTECIPHGQVYFSGLSNGSYNVSVSNPAYSTYLGTTTISGAFQTLDISLSP